MEEINIASHVVLTCNPSTQEVEAGESRVPGQTGLHREILSQKQQEEKKKNRKKRSLYKMKAKIAVSIPVRHNGMDVRLPG
jgi:hypothetical protein